VCWLVVNSLLGVGMQVVAEAVELESTLTCIATFSSTHWPRLLSSLRLPIGKLAIYDRDRGGQGELKSCAARRIAGSPQAAPGAIPQWCG